MVQRLSYVICISIVSALAVVYFLLSFKFWNALIIEGIETWQNINGLSMKRANELFFNCCQSNS
uniref:ATP synthase F0 subunit 8 n=1 Tax=Romanomermis culicivorax TaxID=13658 RepID=A0A915KWK3_ROMCU